MLLKISIQFIEFVGLFVWLNVHTDWDIFSVKIMKIIHRKRGRQGRVYMDPIYHGGLLLEPSSNKIWMCRS